MTLMGKLMASAGVLALSTGFAAAAPAVVQNDLNLRSGPGMDFAVIAAMPAGTRINVMGCEAGWCRVALGDTVGFASRGFLGHGGPVATVPASGSYGVSASTGYAPRYRSGYTYGFGTPAYSERTLSNERGFGERGAVRGQRFASTNVRGNSEVNARQGSEQRAAAIKGNNPMRIRQSSANPNLPRTTGQATAIKGNNPMRIRQSTANPNLPRTTGQAAAIKGNNPMRIRQSTASGNANATTGAAPRENNRSRGSNY